MIQILSLLCLVTPGFTSFEIKDLLSLTRCFRKIQIDSLMWKNIGFNWSEWFQQVGNSPQVITPSIHRYSCTLIKVFWQKFHLCIQVKMLWRCYVKERSLWIKILLICQNKEMIIKFYILTWLSNNFSNWCGIISVVSVCTL